MGDTTKEPVKGTSPMPWSMPTLSAFETVQERVDDSPSLMDGGSAENSTSGGGRALFFLTSTVMEVPGFPMRRTIMRFLPRKVISLSRWISSPRRKSFRPVNFPLRRIGPFQILFSGVFLVTAVSPSPGSSTLNLWKERCRCSLFISQSSGPYTV